jgi:hypothetical protein
MQDIIEDVKELFMLQSSSPYNMMRERERERASVPALGWSVIYPLIYPWIYGKTNTYPT